MRHFLVFLLLTSLFACKFGSSSQVTPDAMHGSWTLADVTNIKSQAKDLPPELASIGSQMLQGMKALMLKNSPTLSLFNDGTYTYIGKTSYEQGVWKLDDDYKSLSMTPEVGDQYQWNIVKKEGDLLTVQVSYGEYTYHQVLKMTAKPLAIIEKDPFHYSLNRWRKRPAQPENDDQLKARMRNHLEHFKAILEGATERKHNVVSWERSPSCIQIYNGGIGLREDRHIDDAFYQCFYAREEADKAIGYYVSAMRKLQNAGAGTGNWIVDDANLILMVLTEF